MGYVRCLGIGPKHTKYDSNLYLSVTKKEKQGQTQKSVFIKYWCQSNCGIFNVNFQTTKYNRTHEQTDTKLIKNAEKNVQISILHIEYAHSSNCSFYGGVSE